MDFFEYVIRFNDLLNEAKDALPGEDYKGLLERLAVMIEAKQQ